MTSDRPEGHKREQLLLALLLVVLLSAITALVLWTELGPKESESRECTVLSEVQSNQRKTGRTTKVETTCGMLFVEQYRSVTMRLLLDVDEAYLMTIETDPLGQQWLRKAVLIE